MHSSSIFTMLSASALFALTSAIPLPPGTCETGSGKSFYTCASNGFSGCCSVDPCNLSWCPNTPNTPTPPSTVTKTNGVFYICGASGFRGNCSYDPCDGKANSWCEDYVHKTLEPKTTKPANTDTKPVLKPVDSAAPVPQYYVCSSNGFRGTCSYDPCDGLATSWCKDYVYKTLEPKTITPAEPKPVEPKPVTKPVDPAAPISGSYYVCASNGFRGTCSIDACNVAWCPDYEAGTYTPKTSLAKRGSEFHCQTLSGHFDGICSSDPCFWQSVWCPDYVPGTYVLKTSTVTPPPVVVAEEPPVKEESSLATTEQRFVPNAGNTCQAGLQFYQCAQFGGVQFNGCCSYDPCYSGSEWCADYKTGSYTLALSV